MTIVHAQLVGEQAVLPRAEFEQLMELARRSEPIELRLEEEDVPTFGIMRLAEQGGAFDWLANEEESDVDNQCHCSETRLEAQIVSLSFVREMREPNLIAVWKSALDFLREADHWII